jgi:hypothetical protein
VRHEVGGRDQPRKDCGRIDDVANRGQFGRRRRDPTLNASVFADHQSGYGLDLDAIEAYLA